MKPLALALAVTFGASGACLKAVSDRITAGDLARAVPEFGQIAPETVISYAPVPGQMRVFRKAELAQRVAAGAPLPESVCFEWNMRTLNAAEVRASMLSVLPAGSDVEVVESGTYPVPEGRLEFPLKGLYNTAGEQRIWRGFVEYAAGRRFDVQARVIVKAPRRSIVPVRPIRARERITGDLLRVETGTGAPLEPDVATETEQVAGRTSRRLLPAGMPIRLDSLQQTSTVARGDPMQVDVISGRARIRFDGIAQAPAADGDTVPVRMRESGRIIHAKVSGAGRAVLDLSASEKEKL